MERSAEITSAVKIFAEKKGKVRGNNECRKNICRIKGKVSGNNECRKNICRKMERSAEITSAVKIFAEKKGKVRGNNECRKNICRIKGKVRGNNECRKNICRKMERSAEITSAVKIFAKKKGKVRGNNECRKNICRKMERSAEITSAVKIFAEKRERSAEITSAIKIFAEKRERSLFSRTFPFYLFLEIIYRRLPLGYISFCLSIVFASSLYHSGLDCTGLFLHTLRQLFPNINHKLTK